MGFKASLMDEVKFLLSGRGMPYEKVCIMVAMVISVILSVILSGNFSKDAPVAVIDLDNSRYSRELITKIDSSEYMKVTAIINTPMNPESLFYRDKVVAVIFLPEGLEKNRYTSSEAPIGIFYDNSNTAQTADIKEAMPELIAIDNAIYSGATTSSGLTLNSRSLFNPAGSTSNTQTLGFLFFFGAMFFTFATIGMIPRLKLSKVYEKTMLNGTPWDLIGRIIPYAFCLTVSTFMGMAVLRVWGDLVFSGRVLEFLFIEILMALTIGVISVFMGWTAANPGVASSRMILFIPGGFILGGVTSPLSHLSPWVVNLAHIFPLTWQFHFTRDIIQRGASLTAISSEIGAFMVYMGIAATLFSWRFYKSRNELLATVKKETLEHLHSEVAVDAWQGINIRNILVPTDGSGQAFKALNQAIHIASACNAKITLMMCVELEQEISAFEQVSMSGYIPSEMNAAAYDFLSELMLVVPREIPVKTRVEIGETGETITEFANADGCDLIVMGSHGFGGAEEKIMGSVSKYVLENSTCPVIFVKGLPDDWADENNYVAKN